MNTARSTTAALLAPAGLTTTLAAAGAPQGSRLFQTLANLVGAA